MEKITKGNLSFYIVDGYAPIIRTLVKGKNYHPWGTLRGLYVEKGKKKIIATLSNKTEIESVIFSSFDSKVFRGLFDDSKTFGDLGFYTKPNYLGKGNIKRLIPFWEECASKFYDLSSYTGWIQEHAAESLGKYFKTLKINSFKDITWYCDTDILYDAKHPYSVNFEKHDGIKYPGYVEKRES